MKLNVFDIMSDLERIARDTKQDQERNVIKLDMKLDVTRSQLDLNSISTQYVSETTTILGSRDHV